MKFSSYNEIVNNYIFLKIVILDLSEKYFLHMTREEMKLEKDIIINELMIDTSFKLLARFEADIRTDYNKSIKTKKKENLSKRYLHAIILYVVLLKELSTV
ncbi:hypothetical protein GMMP15_560114 [Candidatus Magnetomoraceae bacterium gMMP-15]